MFLKYYSVNAQKEKTSLMLSSNFSTKKKLKLENILFSVLDGTNVMSCKIGCLQRRIRHYSHFNVYINCHLAVCLPHIMKHDYLELLIDYDAVLLGLWKMFHYSPKKGALLETVQMIYGKKPLKILNAVTRWLTHRRASQRILELLETLDQIGLDTNVSEVRGLYVDSAQCLFNTRRSFIFVY